jgi:hypothetical protein
VVLLTGGSQILDDPGTFYQEWEGYPCSLHVEEGEESQNQLLEKERGGRRVYRNLRQSLIILKCM